MVGHYLQIRSQPKAGTAPATICVDSEYYVDEKFVNLALDLKSVFGNTLPRRATLERLLKAYREDPESLTEEVLQVFSEAQNNPKPIIWRD